MQRRDFFKWGLAGVGTAALAGQASGLEFYPMPSDKKWAVVYGTWCGRSREAAVWISEGMAGIADVFDARENPGLSGFDHVVIGGSIRSSVTPRELQDFIGLNQALLKEKVRGLFAVCGNMGSPVGPAQTTSFIDNHLARLCDVSGVPSKVFLGRITKSLMDPQTAASMAGAADYDNLKRSECLAFGQQVLQTAASAGKAGSALPREAGLGRNYPNPFNPSSRIDYTLRRPGEVLLRVRDAKGRNVRTLLDGVQQAGEHSVLWDGRDDAGNSVASGPYLYSLRFDGKTITKRMMKVQ